MPQRALVCVLLFLAVCVPRLEPREQAALTLDCAPSQVIQTGVTPPAPMGSSVIIVGRIITVVPRMSPERQRYAGCGRTAECSNGECTATP